MNYYKDLLKMGKKSKIRIALGILFIFISIYWIIDKSFAESNYKLLDWFFSFIFFLNGVLNIVEGSGISINIIFGKSFILINDDEIIYKPHVMAKAEKINWNSVKEVSFNTNKIQLWNTNDSTLSIFYSKLDLASIKELKASLTELCHAKSIVLN